MLSNNPNHQNAQIQEEAAGWFIDLHEAELDMTAREAFNEWLRRSPEHVGAFLKVSAFWEDARAIRRPAHAEFENLVARARSEHNIVPLDIGSSPAQQLAVTAVTPRMPRRWHAPFAMAASVLVMLAVGTIKWNALHSAPSFATEVGEQRSLILDDGSTVELNSRSRIRVAYSDVERKVELLEGQALFHVAKNATRPFIVRSGSARIRAVGTEFDVYRKSTGTIVTVVEGRVAVLTNPDALTSPMSPASTEKPASSATPDQGRKVRETARLESSRARNTRDVVLTADGRQTVRAAVGEILLGAGEQLEVTALTPATINGVTPHAASLAVATAWTERKLIFESTPLREVVEEFNRYNRQHLVIRDPSLYEFHINGVFPSNDAARMIEFLRQRFGVTISQSGNSIEIWRRVAPPSA